MPCVIIVERYLQEQDADESIRLYSRPTTTTTTTIVVPVKP
jgi:hypothetical protein